jgi:hypothetical protein
MIFELGGLVLKKYNTFILNSAYLILKDTMDVEF